MNAVPALAPTVVDQGLKISDLSTSALWLHFMGVLIGAIGGSCLIRDSISAFRLARVSTPAVATPVAAPEALPVNASVNASLQAA